MDLIGDLVCVSYNGIYTACGPSYTTFPFNKYLGRRPGNRAMMALTRYLAHMWGSRHIVAIATPRRILVPRSYAPSLLGGGNATLDSD